MATRDVATTRRKRRVNAVVVYKLVRAPIMLALAVWLTVAPSTVYRSLESLARELSEGLDRAKRSPSCILKPVKA